MSHAARWLVLSLPLVVACGDDETVAALEARVAALEAEDDPHAAIAGLQAEVTALAARLEDAEDALVDVGAVDVSDLIDDLDDLETDLAAVQTSVTAQGVQISTLSSTTTGLQGSVSTNTTQIGALNASVVTLQGTVTTHGTDISGLTSTTSGLQTTVTGHGTQLTGLGTTTSGLQTTVTGLQTTVTGHGTQLTGLSSTTSGLQAAVSELSTYGVLRLGSPVTLDVPGDYPTLASALAGLEYFSLDHDVAILLGEGSHSGDFTIDHPNGDRIHIVGATGNPADVTLNGSILVPEGRALGTLSGLTLQGTSGFGVTVEHDARATLEDMRITGFTIGAHVGGGRLQATATLVDDVATAFSVDDAGSLDLVDVVVTDVTLYGVHAEGHSFVSLERVDTTSAFTGYLMRSGSTLVVAEASAAQATAHGFHLVGGSVLSGYGLTTLGLGQSGVFSDSSVAVLSGSSFTSGGRGLYATGGSSVIFEGSATSIANSAQQGVAATGGSFIDLGDTSLTGSAGDDVWAAEGSWVRADATGLAPGDVSPRGTDFYAFTSIYLP